MGVKDARKVGRHVSASGGISSSFTNALEVGCSTMQIFLSSPRMWKINEITPEQSALFLSSSSESGVSPVFVHMPYLPNLASPKDYIYSRSVETLAKTAEMCDALSIGYLVAHLGSHLGEGKSKGIRNVVEAVSSALEKIDKVHILLEDQAGQTNTVGAELEDIAQIYDEISSKKVGVCLDTCHLFAAGYDIREHGVLDDIDGAIGFGKVECIHLNDAQLELGSHRDRHENIGLGKIGVEGVRSFLSYKRLQGIPLVMETPQTSANGEAKEIRLVRSLIK